LEDRDLGTVKVSPSVLSTLVRLTATGVPGVVAVGASGPSVLGLLRRHQHKGISLRISEDGVHADIELVVRQGVNVVEVGRRVQAEISKSVDKMVGLTVKEINVRVVDVR
jgi:uncharacterized alkaline shock family protein YloU